MEVKTVQNVIDELRTKHGVAISTPFACQLINDATNELVTLYDTAMIPVVIDITGAVGDVPETLVSLGILKVTHDDELYNDYTADSESITFKNDGDYKVTAIITPDDVTAATDDIPVNAAYHFCVVSYVANYAERDPAKSKDNSQFYQLSQAIHNRLSRIKRRGNIIPARLWR